MRAEQPKLEAVYVANVRTALSGPEDGIMKKLPEEYRTGTVKEVLEYLTDTKTLQEDEIPTARSIRSEMSNTYAILVNGKSAKPEDSVAELFEEKKHRDVDYRSVEIEISSVQEGGLVQLV